MRNIGSCVIVVDIVDPIINESNAAHGPISIVPREWREMAGWVIDQCLGGSTSTGGFVTRNISNAINFLGTTESSLTEWAPHDRAQFRESPIRPRSSNPSVVLKVA